MNRLNDIEELAEVAPTTKSWETTIVRHWLLMPIASIAPTVNRMLRIDNATWNLIVLKYLIPFLYGANATVPPYDEFVLIKDTYRFLIATLEAWEAFYKGKL